MRNYNKNLLNASDSQTTIGSAINASQVATASFMAYFGDTQAAGTFKLQCCNDPVTPVKWVDIPSQTVNLTSGASKILTINQSVYQWLRPVYTTTATGAQTIKPVADTGQLNNTWFYLQDEASAHLYYVWINVNSAGTDPMIAGRTGVEIDVATNASAATIGAALATAIAALNSTNSFTASGTTTVTVTNKSAGPFVAMSDGTAPTGFTFAVTAGGSSTINVEMDGLGVPMRNTNINVLSHDDSVSSNGSVVDGFQIMAASFVAYFGDATAAGTFKIQASNDPISPTNWVDIPSQSASITSGASAVLTVANCSYRWMRAVYTAGSGGSTTINVILNALGF